MSATMLALSTSALLANNDLSNFIWALPVIVVPLGLLLFCELLGMRYIPHTCIGVIERLWSSRGSVPEGRIIALNGEAGFQVDLLRGGVHFGLWRWQYRIHKVSLVTVPQGKIGYVYARDGEPLPAGQTLGRVIDCNNFQDARAFLAQSDEPAGQRGRQRAILREGVYAINLALFVVLTEEEAYHLELQGRAELQALISWQNQLREVGGFDPVVVGKPISTADPLHPETQTSVDSIGIITVHDGPSLAPGQIIAPEVGTQRNDPNYHNN